MMPKMMGDVWWLRGSSRDRLRTRKINNDLVANLAAQKQNTGADGTRESALASRDLKKASSGRGR